MFCPVPINRPPRPDLCGKNPTQTKFSHEAPAHTKGLVIPAANQARRQLQPAPGSLSRVCWRAQTHRPSTGRPAC